MTKRYRNFDTFIAEAAGEPITFTVKGETFTLPPTMPATTALRVIRWQKDLGPDADPPVDEVIALCEGFFGGELDRLLATGISTERLLDIMKWAMDVYSGTADDEAGADPGNAQAPAEAEPGDMTSSNTGD